MAAAPARGGAASSSSGDDEGAAAAPAPTRVATVKVTPMPMARPADMVRPSAPAAAQAETAVASAVVPMPPIAPSRPAQAAQVAMASAVPLPPVAPTAVAGKPIPLPPSAPSDGYQLASAEDAGPQMAWKTGAQPMQGQPVQATEPALALASSIPTPKPRPTPDSAIAVLAALPAPTAEQKPREIDPNAASAYQAEASTFPRLPDAFLGKRRVNENGELSLAYAAPGVDVGAAQTRAAVAPQTKVTAAVPTDPNVRVLSPYATPAAVYAAATAPMRRRATLSVEPMVSTPLDEASYSAFLTEARAEYSMEMHHPAHAAGLFVSPTAALAGGFTAAVVGARCDKFQGSSVMLLRTQSFMTGDNLAAKPVRHHG
ncbi:hypothetical protein [Chenggangzhangella methanolivorans]|uniref:hypothetical protein n=1 Tax=Chenggangzhangella methanolivorans TaxID=1437009 RepID=UPI0021BD96A6|nr:hypothetical protein [Chenggangzhangella methanolivorans]